jgi:hypothetical protein
MANIQLQLYELNFDRIGSLPTPRTGFPVPIRPLTVKVHDIMNIGGVNTVGMCDDPSWRTSFLPTG